MRAHALRLRRADPPEATRELPMPQGPEHGRELPAPFKSEKSPTFGPDAIEIRFLDDAPGAASTVAWFRLRVPIVAGEEPSPLQRLAAAADFGNGISSVLPWEDYLFLNADLTLYVERSPRGDWIGLEARTIIPPGGIGLAESVLYDARGRVGRAMQALLVAPRA